MARTKQPTLRPKVIVVVDGGTVKSISADLPVEVVLVDYDNIREGDPPGEFNVDILPDLVEANWQLLMSGYLPMSWKQSIYHNPWESAAAK